MRRILHSHNTKFYKHIAVPASYTIFQLFFFPEIKSPRVLTSQNPLISSRGVSIGYNRQKTLALRQLQRSHAPQKYRASLGWG